MAGLRSAIPLDSGERRAVPPALPDKGRPRGKGPDYPDLVLGVYQGYYGLAAAKLTAEKIWPGPDDLRLAQNEKRPERFQADVLGSSETANAELTGSSRTPGPACRAANTVWAYRQASYPEGDGINPGLS
jgi:hypothetical protein